MDRAKLEVVTFTEKFSEKRGPGAKSYILENCGQNL